MTATVRNDLNHSQKGSLLPFFIWSSSRSIGRLWRSRHGRSHVQPPEQLPTRLEVRHFPRGHRPRLTGSRIASGVCFVLPHGEGAEAAQFDPAAVRQRTDDVLEHRLDNQLGIALTQAWIAGGENRYEFGSGQCPCPPHPALSTPWEGLYLPA